jgi:TFIIF-interacting CTD phosphatase-like protein
MRKRPHLDEFLRNMAKYYKLYIFTAQLREYADPMIDALGVRFNGRYYRDKNIISLRYR